MKDVGIFGVASLYAEDLVESAKRLKLSFELIDNLNLPLVAFSEAKKTIEDVNLPIVVAPGFSSQRAAAVSNANRLGARTFYNLIDPTSVIASTVSFGCGNYLNSLVSVGSSTRISCHTNINRSSTIGHHCEIEPFVSTGPGVVICGSVKVGIGSFIGAGATILPKLRIGKNVIIGAGSVVTSDLPDDVIVYGNPARVIKANEPWIGLEKCLIH